MKKLNPERFRFYNMKKKIIVAALAVSMLAALTGCGKSVKNDPAYLSGVKAEDYVTLCDDYNAIPVEVAAASVTDDYVDFYIQYQLSASTTNQEITTRDDVQDGDIVNIDYTGMKDGVAFDGGTATGYDLTIGSGSFIDGFEEGLIGKKVGDTVTLDLTFPEEYSNEELAGAAVTFDVTINKIQEAVTPELNDEFVASQNLDGVTTVDQYRDYCKELLMQDAQSSYESEVQNAVVSYLEENCSMKQDPPTEMVDRLVASYTDSLTAYAQNYGVDLATYMSYMGSTSENYEDDIRDMAKTTAEEYLILQAIADKEDLNVSDSTFKTEVAAAAASAGYTDTKSFEAEVDTESYREYLMVQNVLAFLTENAIVTEPTATEDATATEATTEAAAEATTEAATEATTEAATEETTEAAAEETTEAAAEATTEAAE